VKARNMFLAPRFVSINSDELTSLVLKFGTWRGCSLKF
jgi:hypothetical protein